jgi:hypothetical protein
VSGDYAGDSPCSPRVPGTTLGGSCICLRRCARALACERGRETKAKHLGYCLAWLFEAERNECLDRSVGLLRKPEEGYKHDYDNFVLPPMDVWVRFNYFGYDTNHGVLLWLEILLPIDHALSSVSCMAE